MNRLTVIVFGVLFCCAASSPAAVLNVPSDFLQINAAVQAASPGDTVLVAAGVYADCVHPTEGAGSTPACVIMRPGVTLIGAGSEATIIDAQGLGRGIYVHGVADVRVENLQIRGAYAPNYGAGLLIRAGASGVRVRDVKIADNLDGGVIVIGTAQASLTRVTFVNNEAKQGGGLSVEDGSTAIVDNCLFDGNRAPSGAGFFVRNGSTATITACTIINNQVDADYGHGGGGAVVTAHCDISASEISYNSTRGAGGGLAYIDEATGLVIGCRLVGNVTAAAYNYGAGISCQSSAPTLRNLLLVDNAASSFGSDGGGIDIQFNPAPIVENCTLVGNRCASGGLAGGILVQWGAAPQITNCIIAGSLGGAGMACVFGNTATVAGSNFWQNAGGDAFCGNDGGCNFSADPLFCDPAGGNFALQANSPCAAGNHPAGGCGQVYCGAFPAGCDVTGVDLPVLARVLGNAPNPFNPQTTIFFVLDSPADVVVRIFDLRGRPLRTFARDDVAAGVRQEWLWDGRDEAGRALPSGVYLYRLEAGDVVTTKRMSLIR